VVRKAIPHIGAHLRKLSGREPVDCNHMNPRSGPRCGVQAGRPGEGGIHLLQRCHQSGIVNAEMLGKECEESGQKIPVDVT